MESNKHELSQEQKNWIIASSIGSFFLLIAIIICYFAYFSRENKQDYKLIFVIFSLVFFIGGGQFTIWRLKQYIIGSNIILTPYYILIGYLLYLFINLVVCIY